MSDIPPDPSKSETSYTPPRMRQIQLSRKLLDVIVEMLDETHFEPDEVGLVGTVAYEFKEVLNDLARTGRASRWVPLKLPEDDDEAAD